MSNKQTEEEVAYMLLARAREEYDGELMQEDGDGFLEGVKYGINWQREQGIDWISLEDGLPQPKGVEKHCGIIITDGQYAKVVAYWFSEKKFPPTLFTVTHWAYITLPKTTQL